MYATIAAKDTGGKAMARFFVDPSEMNSDEIGGRHEKTRNSMDTDPEFAA